MMTGKHLPYRPPFTLLILMVLSFMPQAIADPVWGKLFTFRQPDGTTVQARIWGDEYYRVLESPDGYALIADRATGYLCYAKLSADGTELLSTGQPARPGLGTLLGLPLHLRITEASRKAKIQAALTQAVKTSQQALAQQPAGRAQAPTYLGNIRGLLLLVDFSDDPATIPASEFNNFFNQVGYAGYSNKGSVRDYFYDVSEGKLTYTNAVPTRYYRAAHPKSYYTDPSISFGSRAAELVQEAVLALDAGGFDFRQCDGNNDGYIDAVNCLYAGSIDNNWSAGLWPHYNGVWIGPLDGKYIKGYEISNIGTDLSLGTICHENGHQICAWPDLYDYDYSSYGVGDYCLMCYGGSSKNPVEPCAVLKQLDGWCNVLPGGPAVALRAGRNDIYQFTRPDNPKEYFVVENRYQSGRDASLPDSGLAIWHVDLNVKTGNNNEGFTPAAHYMVSLEQADGRWDMEYHLNYGDATDLFDASHPVFSFNSNPNSKWWDGALPNFRITNVSAPGSVMTMNTTVPNIQVTGNGSVIPSDNNLPLISDGTFFGVMPVNGAGIERTFLIQNTSSATLNLNGIPRVQLSGGNAADFTVTQLPAASVASKGSTFFKIKGIPKGNGTRYTTVIVPSDDPDKPSFRFYIQIYGTLANEAAQAITLFNDGLSDLIIKSMAFDTYASWITWNVGPPLTISGNSGRVVVFSIDYNKAPAGASTRRILITSNDYQHSPYPNGLTIVTNNNLPGLSVSPVEGMSCTEWVGAFTPVSKAYTLRNTGTTTLNWTAAKTKSWVTLSKTGGSLATGASDTITVTVNTGASSLAVGSYSDTVTFTNTTNGVGNTTRAVSLTVNPATPAAMEVSPTAGTVFFSGKPGGPFSPASAVYTLKNTGGSPLAWTLAKTYGWLTASPSGGTLAPGASVNVTLSINSSANTLAAGNYLCTVVFTNATNGQGNTSRMVNLTVQSIATLTVTPATGLTATGNVGGPFSPTNAVYTIKNTGYSTMAWTAGKTRSWLSVSPASGSLAAGAMATVTASINPGANLLVAGTYADTVTFTNTTNGQGNTTRPVSLSVNGPTAWSRVTAAAGWSGRWGHQALVFNNRMWVLGGLDGQYRLLNDVWSSADGLTWTRATSAAPWSSRMDGAAAAFGAKLWLLGGSSGSGCLNDIWSSSDGVTWTRVTAAAPWSARMGHKVLAFGGKLWLMGGQNASGAFLNDVWSSSDGATWTRVSAAAAWGVRGFFTLVDWNGRIWLLGGKTTGDVRNSEVWSSGDGISWTRVSAAAGWPARDYAATLVFGGQLHVFAGWGDGERNDEWSSADGLTWSRISAASPWQARCGVGAVVFNNRMWLLGGRNSVPAGLNDVWASQSLAAPGPSA